MTTAAGASRERFRPRWRTARILAACGVVLVAAGWGLLIAGKHSVGPPMVVTGMALSALGFTFLGSFERLSLARMVQDLPTARIRSAPQGYAEIGGIVQPGSALISCPECGLRCCWFQIQRKKKSRITPASADDVVVDDGTGRCLLRLAGAELISTRRNEGWHAHLLPGDPVHVLGEFRTGASGPPPGAPASAGLAIESVESNRAELVRRKLQWLKYTRPKAEFDVNRDGRLDARELEAMARVAAQRVAREEAQGAAAPPRPDSTVGKPRGETDLPFLVVVGTEREALRALRRGALYYAVSALLTLGFVSAILRDISASQLKDRENLFTLLSTPAAPARAAPKPATAEPASRPVPVRTPRQQAGDLHRANRLEEAVAAYDALLLDDPYDGEIAFWRANALGQLRRQEEAVAGLQHSCDLGYSEACELLRTRFPDAARP